MTLDQPIIVGVFPGFSWIRCQGKGSFVNSPELKSFGDERIADGEKRLVIDLGACTGMDSTFMGTMAGLASRISAKSGGALQVADPGVRNRQSLEDLGLDFMMEIDPPAANWKEQISEIRSALQAPGKPRALPSIEQARHVLHAHQNLSQVNQENAREFKTVVKTLEKHIAEKPERDGDDTN